LTRRICWVLSLGLKSTILTKPLNRPSHKIKFLRQSAKITGLGAPEFKKLLANIAAIHATFKRMLGDGLTDTDFHSDYHGYVAIDVTNRYFTPTAAASVQDILPLTKEIDPHGTLTRAAGTAYVHTEENKVYYFEKKCDGPSAT